MCLKVDSKGAPASSSPSTSQTVPNPPEAKRRSTTSRSHSREKAAPPVAATAAGTPGTATMRAEMLRKERVMPKTDVPSKLKAMLQENKQVGSYIEILFFS